MDAVGRRSTLLSLVEGWPDEVTHVDVQHLPRTPSAATRMTVEPCTASLRNTRGTAGR
jgi:hypothetical protein